MDFSSFEVFCSGVAVSLTNVILQLWVPIIVGSAIDQLIKLIQGGEAVNLCLLKRHEKRTKIADLALSR